jgi:dTDP-4-dehydrorhamnose reductase|tara:strand:- start:731 stop:1558 length:828 start_codon:yes stop_codon:yes gene_type:complete
MNVDTKKILLTGASGKIGQKLLSILPKKHCYGVFFKKKIKNKKNLIKLDLRNNKKLKILLKKLNPNTVIHLAGMRDPGLNEKKPKESKELNLEVTKNLVKNLNKKTHFIFFSTDKVYEGKKNLYNELSKSSPKGLYGKYKLKSENIIKKKFKKHHIIRMPLVHSDGKDKDFSIIDKSIFRLKKKLKVEVYSNVKRCFVNVDDLIRFIVVILEEKKFGTFNVGSELSSYSDRVKKICKQKNIVPKKNLILVKGIVNPISMRLNIKKFKENFNFRFN